MTAEFYDACKLTDRAKLDEMGLSYKAVMDIALNFTSASIFRWGHMHSDIHPVRPFSLSARLITKGNVLVRQDPRHPSRPQLVVIDHGLCTSLAGACTLTAQISICPKTSGGSIASSGAP